MGAGRGSISCMMYGVHATADGTVYVCEWSTHRVTKWAAGATEGEVVAGGNGGGTQLRQLYHPHGVSVAANGDVFVACYYGHRVMKWVPGATEGVIVAGGNGGGHGEDQLYHPRDVSVAADGTLYIADDYHRILAVPPGGRLQTVAGDRHAGSELYRFYNPYGVEVKAGSIYVADYHNQRVVKWEDSETDGYLQVEAAVVAGAPFGTTQRRRFAGSGADQLNNPYGISVTADGTVLVADHSNHRVVAWPPNATEGTVVAGGNGGGSRLDQFNGNWDVAVAADGAGFYATDHHNHRVVYWENGATAGQVVAGFGQRRRHSQPHQLYYPMGLAVDSAGTVLIADHSNHRGVRYTATEDGGFFLMTPKVVAGGQGRGQENNKLYDPYGVAVEGPNIFVSDRYHRVMRWKEGDMSGVLVAGGRGSGRTSSCPTDTTA